MSVAAVNISWENATQGCHWECTLSEPLGINDSENVGT